MVASAGRSSRREEVGLTIALVAVNGVVFATSDVIVGGQRLNDQLLPTGSRIDGGQVWRPLTSLFAHLSVGHLVINSALLVVVTPWAVRRLGVRRFLTVYLGCGFAANAFRYAVGGRRGGGASAGIAAVAAAAIASDVSGRGSRALNYVVIGSGTLAGLCLARWFSDNHLLAIGIGAAVVLDASTRPIPRRFPVRLAAIVSAAAAAMATRIALSG